MTGIIADAASFTRDAISGFCDAYSDFVVRVPGGVLSAADKPDHKVTVVVGGGSGHYPAFAGYVGFGLADAAACGDVFASPSSREVYEVARSATGTAGVLLLFGNYAGDVLNFGLAAERLRAGGIDTQTLAITDDLASADPSERHKRRGVAGGIVVFKIAGAAAEAGYDLDRVARVASGANDATRSFGVAFRGCVLPGASEPLFSVTPGRMALGLGVHGEPGIAETDLLPAAELAELLVERVLADQPTGSGHRVAVMLNGLGATKYEELFVLWSYVAPLLRTRGLELVGPRVGELITSLDMAGCSLTVSWLDDERERLWTAPAQAPAYFTWSAPSLRRQVRSVEDSPVPEWPTTTPESRQLASGITGALRSITDAVAHAEEDLGRLDAIAGDGDHGRGMLRGSRAAFDAARLAEESGAGAQSVLAAAADAWADRGGGTSGALWGVALRAWSAELSDMRGCSPRDAARGAQAALAAVTALGGAKVGDKTLVDVLDPFVRSLASQVDGGVGMNRAWQTAAEVAAAAAESTAQLSPTIGRARPLAARSMNHRDGGAVSLALCIKAVARTLGAKE